MTQFVMGPDNVVQMLPDPQPTDPISTSISKQGIYQSPEGWAIVTGSPGGQLGGAPRIILDTNGKQPPQEVLSRFPMASPQEQQGFQQQAAKYRAGEGKSMSIGQAALAAAAAYFGASAAGGMFGGAGALPSPAGSAIGDLAGVGGGGGVNPAGFPEGSFRDGLGNIFGSDGQLIQGAENSWDVNPRGGSMANGDWGIYDETSPQLQWGQNPDGSFGSTAANSSPGGYGTTVPLGGEAGAYTPGFADGMRSLMSGITGLPPGSGSLTSQLFGSGSGSGSGGISPLASLLGLGVGGNDLMKVLGGLGSAGLGAYAASQQTDALKSLAQQQMAAEQARYAEQRDINQARYQTQQQQSQEATQRAIDARTGAQVVVAPSQARYEASYAPGFTMSNDPGFTDALNLAGKSAMYGASVNGNPAGSPNAWAQTQSDLYSKFAYPALQGYRQQNAATGFGGPYASVAASPAASTIPGMSPSVGFGTPTAGADQSAAAIGANSNIYGALGKGIANVTNPPQTLSDWIAANQNKGSSIFG